MKTSRTVLLGLFLLALACGPTCAHAFAQGHAVNNHFSGGGILFDYPATMKFKDMSAEGGQHLVLLDGGTGAQIMVISRYDKITSAEQLAEARTQVYDAFVDSMWQELQKMDPKLRRSPAQVEIGGAQATGVRLRAVVNNEAANAEIYSLLLGQRLVLMTLIGTDREIAAATPAWSIIRRTLKVESGSQAGAVAGPTIIGPTNQGPAMPDTSTVTGQTYSNRFFGLTLTIPQGWQVQDARVKELISKTGKELVNTEDKNKQSQIEAAVDRTINLLTVTEHAIGSTPAFNPTFVALAEKTDGANSNEYLAQVRNVFPYSKVPVTVKGDIYRQILGGADFGVMDIELNFPGGVVQQRYYARVKNGYALAFIISYQTEEQLQSLAGMLKSVRMQ